MFHQTPGATCSSARALGRNLKTQSPVVTDSRSQFTHEDTCSLRREHDAFPARCCRALKDMDEPDCQPTACGLTKYAEVSRRSSHGATQLLGGSL